MNGMPLSAVDPFPATPRDPPMSDASRRHLKEKAEEEAKAFFPVFFYVWFLLAIFGLHKSIVLSQAHIIQHQGFAIAKALAFAKVLFIAERMGVGRRFDKEPLIAAVLFKSVVFALLLIGMDIVEEKIIVHFWPTHADKDGLDFSNLRVLLSAGTLTFASLLPFFGLRELSGVIGEKALLNLFFQRRERFIPLRQAQSELSTKGGIATAGDGASAQDEPSNRTGQ